MLGFTFYTTEHTSLLSVQNGTCIPSVEKKFILKHLV